MSPLFRGWFAGVGSRETPEDILALMRQLSQALYADVVNQLHPIKVTCLDADLVISWKPSWH